MQVMLISYPVATPIQFPSSLPPNHLTGLRAQEGWLLCRLDRCRRHILDLLDQEFPLINELFILGPILQEMLQKRQESFSVDQQYLLYSDRFVWIRNEHFENMESFVLHHLSLIPKEVHAYLQMLSSIHIGCHYSVVCPVQQYFAQQLY
jgi:hypothetical protein